MLKEDVIQHHFLADSEYRNAKGRVLATYKAVESLRFDSSRFKEDHPDVYQIYSEKKLTFRFELKR